MFLPQSNDSIVSKLYLNLLGPDFVYLVLRFLSPSDVDDAPPFSRDVSHSFRAVVARKTGFWRGEHLRRSPCPPKSLKLVGGLNHRKCRLIGFVVRSGITTLFRLSRRTHHKFAESIGDVGTIAALDECQCQAARSPALACPEHWRYDETTISTS